MRLHLGHEIHGYDDHDQQSGSAELEGHVEEHDHQLLSCRVWADNVNILIVALDNVPHSRGERYSTIYVSIPRMNEWVDLRIRLDEFSRHRNFRGNALIRVGDPVWKLLFKARRADKNKRLGAFYLDDVRVYARPETEKGGK